MRIFTPQNELPFAGHPTLGTCHAWLEARYAGSASDAPATVVQDCGAGPVQIRRTGERLAFAGPPLVRYEPVEGPLVERIATLLGIARTDVVDAHWVDNGPGWVAVLLADADAVRAVRGVPPNELCIGLVGPYPAGSAQEFEVRAFFSANGMTFEDPVTGSLNASLGQWLLDTKRTEAPYVVSQGAAVGREGRVHVDRDADGTVWVGGGTVTRITGDVDL